MRVKNPGFAQRIAAFFILAFLTALPAVPGARADILSIEKKRTGEDVEIPAYNLRIRAPEGWYFMPSGEDWHIIAVYTSQPRLTFRDYLFAFYLTPVLEEGDTPEELVWAHASKKAAALGQENPDRISGPEAVQAAGFQATASAFRFVIEDVEFMMELVSFRKGNMLYLATFWGPFGDAAAENRALFRQWLGKDISWIDPSGDLPPEMTAAMKEAEGEPAKSS